MCRTCSGRIAAIARGFKKDRYDDNGRGRRQHYGTPLPDVNGISHRCLLKVSPGFTLAGAAILQPADLLRSVQMSRVVAAMSIVQVGLQAGEPYLWGSEPIF